jgi:hypothetical protein
MGRTGPNAISIEPGAAQKSDPAQALRMPREMTDFRQRNR